MYEDADEASYKIVFWSRSTAEARSNIILDEEVNCARMMISEKSSRVTIVVPQQSAQKLFALNVAEIHICFSREFFRRTSRCFRKRTIAEALVRTTAIAT